MLNINSRIAYKILISSMPNVIHLDICNIVTAMNSSTVFNDSIERIDSRLFMTFADRRQIKQYRKRDVLEDLSKANSLRLESLQMQY